MAKKKDDHILPFPIGGQDEIRTKDDLLQMVLLEKEKTMMDLSPEEKEIVLATVDRFWENYAENPGLYDVIMKLAAAEGDDDYDDDEYTLAQAKADLKRDPDDLDAAVFVAQEEAKDDLDLLKKTASILKKGNKIMEREGYFEDCAGAFWGVWETRPYMRARYFYMMALLACGMFTAAVDECKAMLALCEGDNLGVRYDLMHLYAYFEDLDNALALKEEYDENTAGILLPLAVLYFKRNDLKTAEKYLRQIAAANPDTKAFFEEIMYNNELPEEHSAYRARSIEELENTFVQHLFLYQTVLPFFSWGLQVLKKRKK